MNRPSSYLDALVREFSRLPGIGSKSASRLAFHILKMPLVEVESLAAAIVELKQNISVCRLCGGISDGELCSICGDETRDRETICIIEEAKDVFTIDATGEYTGLFHVLMGVISPLDGIGPEELNIASLIHRCEKETIRELIIALNPTIEGDATSLYLARQLQPLGIKVTRIAHGLPVGSDLEFVDTATIVKSIEGRSEIF
ncbi:MAG: recombination protein RecR [bacterium]|nr:recombination protein RecR [bacterium]